MSDSYVETGDPDDIAHLMLFTYQCRFCSTVWYEDSSQVTNVRRDAIGDRVYPAHHCPHCGRSCLDKGIVRFAEIFSTLR